MRPRVVLDTNVLVSHFLVPGGNPSKILDWIAAEKAVLLSSEFILGEFSGILAGKTGFSQSKVAEAEASIRTYAEIVSPRHMVDVVRKDPSDNHILECALSGQADVLVTGDKKHLLPLKKFRSIPILSPADFLKAFFP